MKAVIVNGSPHMDRGNTALLVEPFAEGLREGGAAVEILYTRKLAIEPCEGDYACWFKTPGRCYKKDDMNALLPAIAGADALVFASPVYVDGVTGPLKCFMDRLIPIGRPDMEDRGGRCRHPQREVVERGALAVVSNCGFYEMENFDPLVAHMRALAENLGRSFAGALLRPHGGFLKPMLDRGMAVGDVLDAARRAGVELARDGRISEEAQRIVGRNLLPRETYLEMANERVRKNLDAIR